MIEEKHYNELVPRLEPITHGIWWGQIDGSWKDGDKFSGQGWICSKEEVKALMMGARNIRRSRSPLHADLEALIWTMECMQGLQRLEVVLITDCSDVVKIMFSPEEWSVFVIHLDEVIGRKSSFNEIQISYRLKTTNTRVDNLTKSTREFLSKMVYINSDPSAWLVKEF